MKVKLMLIIAICLLTTCLATSNNKFINSSMDVAQQQALLMADYMSRYPDKLPRTYDQKSDSIFIADSKHWVSGFYPGLLWYLYEYRNDQKLKSIAENFLSRVEKEKYNTYDHDIGFQIYCSFGNAFRLTDNKKYKEVILTAAHSATKRFNKKIGLIRSWDFGREKWQYPVIIDNMMNLELLMKAFHLTKDSLYYRVAVSHADNTLKHHFRHDFSSYHVVSYDTITGLPHVKMTHQGAFDESHWARGQAWALYGYTMMYRETGLRKYLTQAINIAGFIINHPNMPKDMIPYWDLLAADIPNTYRDASAAAIMASALIELSGYVDKKQKSEFLKVAETQLKSLSGPAYLAKPGTNGFFILKQSVGNMPRGHEVDAPLSYADYYFLEALIRFSRTKRVSTHANRNLSDKDTVKIQTSGVVRYSDFGAVGDGKTDDIDAIAAAHAFANLHQLPVKADGKATYYISGKNRTAIIQTNTDFDTAKFIIDDRNVQTRQAAVFSVTSALKPFKIEGINTLAKNQQKLNIAFPGPCLVIANDSHTMRYVRM